MPFALMPYIDPIVVTKLVSRPVVSAAGSRTRAATLGHCLSVQRCLSRECAQVCTVRSSALPKASGCPRDEVQGAFGRTANGIGGMCL
jgi:hypothetical protein